MPSAPTAGYAASLLLTSQPSVAIASPVVLTDAGDHINYQMPYAAIQRFLDPNVAVVVQISTDGGVTWSAAPSYTLTYVGAHVTFAVANGASTQVRVQTGNYFPYATLSQATDYTVNSQRPMQDVTAFTGNTAVRSKTYLPVGQFDSNFTFKQWHADNSIMALIQVGSFVGVSCVLPNSKRYEGYGYMKGDSVKNILAASNEEDVSFTVSGQFAYN